MALSRSTSSRFDINVGLDESLARDSLPVELQWLHPGMCNLDPSQRIGLVTRLRAHADETGIFGSIRVLNGVNTRGVAFVTMIALRSVCDNEQ